MTEKEMIEELGKAMCEEFRSEHCGNDCDCANEFIAKKLIEQGYRKIPEDFVVLSKATYYEQQNFKYELGYNTGKQIARKETEKEFFTELFKQYSVFNDNDVIIAWQVKEALKELAKKHGVEVEE